MTTSLEQKKAMVAEVNAVAAGAHSAVAAEYRGLTVSEMNDLRTRAREGGVYLRVVKNTLARRAVEGTDFECLQGILEGPLVLAFSQNDPAAAARVLTDYAKTNEKLVLKSVAFGGQLYGADEARRLATLPTYDEAIARLMGLMKAPIEKFVRTLNEPHAKLARTLAAVRDQKQQAA